MRIQDLISFSLQSFKNRRSRMILTVLGMAVAIAVILFLVSLGYGLQKTILERITTEDSLLTLDVFPPETESIKLDNESIDTISALPNVAVVSPQAVITSNIQLGELTSETVVNAVNEDFFRLAGIKVEQGEALSDETPNQIVVSPVVAELFAIQPEELLQKTVVVTFDLSQLVKPPENELDLTVSTPSASTKAEPQIFTREFTITGITGATDETNQAFISIANLSTVEIAEYQFVKIQVDDQKNIEETRQSLIDSGYLVSALSDVVSQANQIFGIIQLVLAIFGIFSLCVAAIGLINTMTISLLERINEIGIMRAIGASAWDIKKIFLIESTLIGFFGGVVGIVLGMIGGLLFNIGLNLLARSLGGQPVSIFHTPFWFIFFIVIFSAGVGFLAGIMPAQKAGKLNALEALRYK